MRKSDLRALLNAEWSRIDQEAERKKDSHRAIFALARIYRSLSQEERVEADKVLSEWALLDDPKKRFDALALIDEFSISSAVAALKLLADRFRREQKPSSPYDLVKVNRILERLTGNDTTEGEGE